MHYGPADVQLRRDRTMYERDVAAVEDPDLETILATEEYLFIMQSLASASEWARATLAGK